MKEMNLCSGCFYAGAVDGFKPECNCQNRTRYEEEEDEQETITEGVASNVKTNQKRQKRRISKRKANKKANQMLPIVEAKCRKLPDYANKLEHDRLENKCKNAEKKAKRNKQVTVTISFPTSIEKKVQGKGISKLESLFSDWADKPEKVAERATEIESGVATKIAPKVAKEIVKECNNTIEMLETARMCNGEVVALYKEQNKIFMTMGFYTKKDLSNFKRKTEKAS